MARAAKTWHVKKKNRRKSRHSVRRLQRKIIFSHSILDRPDSGKAGGVMIATLKHLGLPEGVSRIGFIDRIRPALVARGIRATAIAYLDRAFNNWTRDQDFKPGRVCGHWNKVKVTAKQLSKSPRTINSVEVHLNKEGLIKTTPKANGARDGFRETGDKAPIRWLHGINLAPIIDMAAELIEESKVILLAEEAKELCQSEIRSVNKRIRKLGNALAVQTAQDILPQGRTAVIKEVHELKKILAALVAVEKEFSRDLRSEKTSDQQEENQQPIVQNKKQQNLYKQGHEDVRISVSQAVNLANPEFQEYLAMYQARDWQSIVQVAYEVSRLLQINERIWQKACEILGRRRAALCIILIHRNHNLHRSDRYFVENPGRCLAGILKKTRIGGFNFTGLLQATQRRTRSAEGLERACQ